MDRYLQSSGLLAAALSKERREGYLQGGVCRPDGHRRMLGTSQGGEGWN